MKLPPHISDRLQEYSLSFSGSTSPLYSFRTHKQLTATEFAAARGSKLTYSLFGTEKHSTTNGGGGLAISYIYSNNGLHCMTGYRVKNTYELGECELQSTIYGSKGNR